jgi:tRNA (guanine-N7-)-methyltransferase
MSALEKPSRKRGLKTAFAKHMEHVTFDGDTGALSSKASRGQDKLLLESTSFLLDENNMPKKRYFRSRAHCNPLSNNDGFQYPLLPSSDVWEAHYPNIEKDKRIVRILDIGMGFGGLTVALAKLFPDKLVLGMEIRAKVTEYVRLRIDALRNEDTNMNNFQNAACLRTNCMRYLPNFFEKGQIEKMFFAFPDPHFKAKNHKRRIVNTNLLTEYAYFLKPNGRLYCITDVEDLHKWHVEKCTAHPCFERLPDEEMLTSDPAVKAMIETTEEGIKVARNKGSKFWAVYRRREEAEIPPVIQDFVQRSL